MNQGTAMLWMSQLQRKVESQASSNQARAHQTRTLAETVRLADVSIPAEIRCMKSAIPGLRSLNNAIERRLTEQVQERLKLIQAKDTAADAKAERGRFMIECNVLRGAFAQQYRLADSESARLVYLKEKAEKPSADSVEPSTS
jgi:hypothetical protein